MWYGMVYVLYNNAMNKFNWKCRHTLAVVYCKLGSEVRPLKWKAVVYLKLVLEKI